MNKLQHFQIFHIRRENMLDHVLGYNSLAYISELHNRNLTRLQYLIQSIRDALHATFTYDNEKYVGQSKVKTLFDYVEDSETPVVDAYDFKDYERISTHDDHKSASIERSETTFINAP